mmetsp:Transcript_22981/g.71448  ORF Transcript_22981/g.71448 Transcript_22981/m.71448 type:complete len:534 (+) Transcript_22981:776-2377(+)
MLKCMQQLTGCQFFQNGPEAGHISTQEADAGQMDFMGRGHLTLTTFINETHAAVSHALAPPAKFPTIDVVNFRSTPAMARVPLKRVGAAVKMIWDVLLGGLRRGSDTSNTAVVSFMGRFYAAEESSRLRSIEVAAGPTASPVSFPTGNRFKDVPRSLRKTRTAAHQPDDHSIFSYHFEEPFAPIAVRGLHPPVGAPLNPNMPGPVVRLGWRPPYGERPLFVHDMKRVTFHGDGAPDDMLIFADGTTAAALDLVGWALHTRETPFHTIPGKALRWVVSDARTGRAASYPIPGTQGVDVFHIIYAGQGRDGWLDIIATEIRHVTDFMATGDSGAMGLELACYRIRPRAEHFSEKHGKKQVLADPEDVQRFAIPGDGIEFAGSFPAPEQDTEDADAPAPAGAKPWRWVYGTTKKGGRIVLRWVLLDEACDTLREENFPLSAEYGEFIPLPSAFPRENGDEAVERVKDWQRHGVTGGTPSFIATQLGKNESATCILDARGRVLARVPHPKPVRSFGFHGKLVTSPVGHLTSRHHPLA